LPFQIRVPAKVNLWLEVIRKRSDGYHELSSLMLPIDVYDRLELSLQSGGISLTCNHAEVPENEANLAWKAAELYLEATRLITGVKIRLEKAIPAGAGLGGGSADAAGVLLAMNEIAGRRLSMDELHALAGRLGADVPFFLYCRPAMAGGIGEKLERVEGIPCYPLVLIKPPMMVSTRWVYQSLKLTRGESRIRIATFLAHPWRLHDVMQNDLEIVTLDEYPLLAKMKEWLKEHGAVGVLMSGSGPTVFGVFQDRSHAERVGILAKQAWKGSWVRVAETLPASLRC